MSDPNDENRIRPDQAASQAIEEPALLAADRHVLELAKLARKETPSSNLAERVLEQLAYRTQLLEDPAQHKSLPNTTPFTGTYDPAALEDPAQHKLLSFARRRTLGVTVVGVTTALAAAAAVIFWFQRLPDDGSEIRPEPVRLSATAAQATAALDPCLNALVANGTAPLIDDFEDGNDAVSPLEGRHALWRWVRDTDAPGTAPALLPIPRPGATAENQLALHVKGDRLREWGASVEFVFDKKCYDASAYAGVSFSARGSTRIYVAPREVSVMPIAEGGLCENDCHNNHVAQIQLDDEWRSYEVRFDQVEQRGYDRPPLNPKRLHSLAFLIRSEDTPYAVWIDDLRFIER